MKKVLIALCAFAVTAASAQSHTQGQIQINADYELQVGTSSSLEQDGNSVDFDGDLSVAGQRFDVQYGLTEDISLGLAARVAVFTQTVEFFGITADATSALFDIGLEPRYYILNEDDMNLFGAATVGLTSATADLDGAEASSGLFYGLGVGFNYFFTDLIGANIRVGYSARNTSDESDVLGTTVETKSSISGVDVGVGLSLKFGGN